MTTVTCLFIINKNKNKKNQRKRNIKSRKIDKRKRKMLVSRHTITGGKIPQDWLGDM